MIEHDDKLDLKGLLTSDRAVSPVIGVILMVAITVILAAVIATFVLGLGQQVGTSAPAATIEVTASASSDTVELEHNGGDALHADRTRLSFTIAGSSQTIDPAGTDSVFSVGDSVTWDFSSTSSAPTSTWSTYSNPSTSTFAPGDTVAVQIIDTDSQKVIFETEVTAG